MGDELKPYPLARWDAVNDGVEGETGCTRSTEMDAPRDGGRGGVAMEGSRNCYECMHGPESKVCPACGATGGLAGKVWPSVEGETVIKGMPFVLDDPVLTQDRFDDAVAQVTEAIEHNWRTGCRIIVQSLKEG
jgi:hypothetical protein